MSGLPSFRISPQEQTSSGWFCRLPLWTALSVWILYCVISLSGCMRAGPDFTPLNPESPKTWAALPGTAFQTGAAAENWWTLFQDEALVSLVLKARRNSPDIETALLRIAQARASFGQAFGSLFPQEQMLTGSAEWSRPSRRAPDASQPGEPAGPRSLWEINTGMQVQWELDLWGKYLRGVEAAQAELKAMQAAYDLALVSLTADVAQQYVTYRMTEKELEIATRNARIQEESVRLTEARFRLGAANRRDYQQAVAQQKSTNADIPSLHNQLLNTRNSLCLLLGEQPGELAELTQHKPLPSVPSTLLVGIPAEMLRRRPDVRQAEASAAAESARIGIARAEMLPSFSLSGFLGFAGSVVGAFTLGQTWKHGSMATFSPALSLPFLNYGRLQNAVRAQDAQFQQALVAYRKTVLTALGEAENAMSGVSRNRERSQQLEEGTAAAASALKLTREQYAAGETDFTSVLTAQATLYQQENALVQARGASVLQAVQLFRALGGGWETDRPGLAEKTVQQMEQRTGWGDLLPQDTSLPRP